MFHPQPSSQLSTVVCRKRRIGYNCLKLLYRIGALANVDPRLMEALNRRLDGSWTYGQRTSHSGLLTTLAEDLQLPPSWGDSLLVPTHGGDHATKKWAELGVTNRSGIGGVPCEIVHGDVGKPFGIVGPSCTTNAVFAL